MKKIITVLATATALFALPSDTPIEPWDQQPLLGKGFDVSWAEFSKNIDAYSDLQVKGMKEKGFSTARIRTKLPADETLFAHLDQVIQDCFDNDIIPMIAYNCATYEAEPTEANRTADSLWWNTVAEHYQDYSHKLLFDLNIEWSDVGGKDIDGVNSWYESVTPAIRETNPTRIIFYSPIKLSNPTYLPDMIIPESAGDYVMAEFHSYAAGPNADSLSDNGKPNPKFWTTGTEYQKDLVSSMIGRGRAWQDSTNIPTWLGAWMAGNNNHGNNFTTEQQEVFATYFVKVLDSLEIPWAINTLDMYYDIDNDIWIDSVAGVLVSLQGSDDGTAIEKNNFQINNLISFSQIGNKIQISNAKNYKKLSLFSLNGRELFSQNIVGNSGQVQINNSNLSAGSYIIRLNGKINFTQKIVLK